MKLTFLTTGCRKMTNDVAHKIDENRVWEEDVRHMSYEDLMAAVRFLDHERQVLTKMTTGHTTEQQNKPLQKTNKAA